eukprot:TRINITY_DN81683_c0_g1_i1.p1 TRINITY_DN81683_c0_g1~~TRINITY_DN81683_c0_g1_i1.p1  ORF type:complete len:103 (+),score=14.78 TRINITY_DN81683_c0_g1_i1:96-404(+)
MQSGPITWDDAHDYQNPVTGSFHSPPGSGLLGWSSFEGDALHESSPARLFPSIADLASRPRELVQGSSGGFNPFSLLCGCCCPAMASDQSQEIDVRRADAPT